MRKKRISYLFFISILLISSLFISCSTTQTQLKTSNPETIVSATLKSSLIETSAEAKTIAKETETIPETNTIESAKETAETKFSETVQEVITDTTIATIKSPLKVHFIDVGQGDSILIQTPEGNTMLIDGGPQSSASSLVSYLKDLGITKLNVVIATHPHEDHIGGLVSVLNNFEVGNILDSGVNHTTKIYSEYLNTIKSKNINFVNWEPGQEFSIGDGVEFTILGPITKSSDLNNSSIVIRLTYGINSFLFAGDAQNKEESQIISSGVNLNSDVLKVGHHGSSSSLSIEFLKDVSPNIAVISCGVGNSYGHPHSITLKNLINIDSVIYRTDLTGTIVIQSDGTSINVITGSPYVYSESKTTQTTVAETTQQVTETTQSTQTSPPEATIATEPTQPQQSGAYVGSIKSDVFHYPNCKYVKKILPENIIWFSSREDAISKGYRPCKVCNP
ncbi:MAG: MBL fold metallo-hydrolase [Actinobacteria bacterium]|nr:MBL fold metallo-hydrolase [Actinomycetota bacterium]